MILPCTVFVKMVLDGLDNAVPIEIVIVPLTSTFEPDPDIMPLSVMIRPPEGMKALPEYYPRSLAASVPEIEKARTFGVSTEKACGSIDRWFSKLSVDKLMPISFGYALIAPCLMHWMGSDFYFEIFDWSNVDLVTLARCSLDREKANMVPLTVYRLLRACNTNEDRHDDCMTIAVSIARAYQFSLDHLPIWW